MVRYQCKNIDLAKFYRITTLTTNIAFHQFYFIQLSKKKLSSLITYLNIPVKKYDSH